MNPEPHKPSADPTQAEAARADSAARDTFEAGEVESEPLSRDEEMDALRREAEEARDREARAHAELENFRKRMRRDYEDQLRFASLALINDILEVRDNLNRAIDAAQSTGAVDSLREGVAMVAKQLDDTLGKYGVKKIDDSGEFDPHVHEAISQMPSPEHAAGHIAHVAVTGYMLHDRVVRPSQVVVSTGSPQA